MPRDEELPIIRAFYDFMLWMIPKNAKFPRDQQFVLGSRGGAKIQENRVQPLFLTGNVVHIWYDTS